jgi:hypothetical protein
MNKRLLILVIILVILIIILILITMGIFSFFNKNKENQLESRGYKLLTNVSEFPKEYQEVINAVIDKLKSEENNPDDYYVKIKQAEEYGANTIIISLIHKDSFEQKDANKVIAGNPSGKDRNIYYCLDIKKITKDLLTR